MGEGYKSCLGRGHPLQQKVVRFLIINRFLISDAVSNVPNKLYTPLTKLLARQARHETEKETKSKLIHLYQQQSSAK